MAEDLLIEKYRKMVGLDNLKSTGTTTIIQGNSTVLSNITISGNSIVSGNIIVGKNLNISGTSLIYGDININTALTVLQTANISNTTSVLNTLNIANNTTVLGTINIGGNLRANNITVANNISIRNNLTCNTITCTNINNNSNILNINADEIIIGNSSSIINIYGTTTNVVTNELKTNNKLISLNYDQSTGKGCDIGNNSGLEFYNQTSSGYIKTNNDATRFVIKVPNTSEEKYIATLDANNNLNVGNNAILHNNVTIFSNLNVSNNTIVNLNCVATNINILNNATFNNTVTCNNLFANNCVFNNNITVLNNITALNNIVINNNVTGYANLNVSGSMFIQNNAIVSNINISNNTTINNNLTIGNNLNVLNNFTVLNNLTVGSDLFVSNNTIINSNTTVLSNTTIGNNLFVSGNIIVNRDMTISGNTIINGNISLGTNNSIINILGDITTSLFSYDTNTDAINGGVPLWGLYRTGGIIKIRLDNIPPVITLQGSAIFNNIYSTDYIEPGITAIDNLDGAVDAYIISIASTTTSNIITTPIKVVQNSVITNVSILNYGLYTITYRAEDSASYYSTAIRTLNVIISPYYVAYVINVTGANVYNATTSQYATIATYASGINDSNIYWSYDYRTTVSTPVIYRPNVISTPKGAIKFRFGPLGTPPYSPPGDKDTFMSTYGYTLDGKGFSLSNSFFNTMDTTGTWNAVFKIKKLYKSVFQIVIESDITNYGNNEAWFPGYTYNNSSYTSKFYPNGGGSTDGNIKFTIGTYNRSILLSSIDGTPLSATDSGGTFFPTISGVDAVRVSINSSTGYTCYNDAFNANEIPFLSVGYFLSIYKGVTTTYVASGGITKPLYNYKVIFYDINGIIRMQFNIKSSRNTTRQIPFSFYESMPSDPDTINHSEMYEGFCWNSDELNFSQIVNSFPNGKNF